MVSVSLVNYERPPNCGGGGVFTADLADGLRTRGHDVDVVADKRESATTSTRDLVTFPVRSLPDARDTADSADIINGHFAVPSSLLLPVVARRTDTPLVVNLMGADVYDPTRYDRVRPLLDATLKHWVGRHADALVVPSEDMAGRVPAALQDRVRVIPYFVDTKRFTPAAPDPTDPIRLLTVARLVERKRLDRAIRALSHLADRDLDATLTIAGTGPEEPILKATAEEHGVASRVEFTGFVPEADLPGLYREHNIFVLPSAHEAFGIAAAEAMASGLPVVATDTGGHAEVAGEAGEVVAPRSEAVADGIATVWADLTDRSHAARERACARFSADAVIPQYEQIFREVAE